MLNSLSLFSGYAGIDLALSEYCRPILYCEKDLYAQGIILSRMDEGLIPFAPIWNDVTTLDGAKLRGMVDIISGGFPCQDISSAGKGAGLAGERSGLFYEIVRLTKEIRPAFVFLENVPAIRTRGLEQVVKEFTEMGYDCRWTMLSAASIGAPHKRERWFFLAHANSELIRQQSGWREWESGKDSLLTGDDGSKEFMARESSRKRWGIVGNSKCEWNKQKAGRDVSENDQREKITPARPDGAGFVLANSNASSPGLERQHWCKRKNTESP